MLIKDDEAFVPYQVLTGDGSSCTFQEASLVPADKANTVRSPLSALCVNLRLSLIYCDPFN
jgi:hypothetical protein